MAKRHETAGGPDARSQRVESAASSQDVAESSQAAKDSIEVGSASSKTREIHIDYVKSTQHRVLLVSGAHGGLSPDGRHIHMSVFNERTAIPQRDSHLVNEDGTLQPRHDRKGRSDIVREVEATLMFDVPCALRLRQWLDQAIGAANSVTGQHGEEA